MPFSNPLSQAFRLGDMGFGAMRTIGKNAWGWPRDRRRSIRLLEEAPGLGVSFFDTADAYGPETSEYLLCEALHPYEGLCIATKGGCERSGPRDWPTNGRPEHLRIACVNSMRRLQVDCIDLYQLHAVDDEVPLEDSVGELSRLQQEGKIRFIGLSNVSIEELDSAQTVADIVSVQNRLNLFSREHLAVQRHCLEKDILFLPWYPLDAGKAARSEVLRNIGAAQKATAAQLSLAWLRHQGDNVLPIPGTSSLGHLKQNMGATSIVLGEEALQKIDSEVSSE